MTELNLNGYTDLPPGKIANVAHYLEMRALPARARAPRDDLTLRRIKAAPLDWYRALYRRIGEDWLWFSRLILPEDQLKTIITSEHTLIWAVLQDGMEIGLIEFDIAHMPSIELAFFGIVPEATGGGIGRWMMDEALAQAFSLRPERVWVHTCTLDHPSALPFYVSSGFTPYKRSIEIADDPRLTGALPRNAAPHIPIL